MFELHGDVVLVTGGSRGIGRAIARELSQAGAEVIVQYHTRQDAAEAVARELEHDGGSVLTLPSDVSNLSSIREMVDRAGAWRGRLDGLVTAAGIYRGDATRTVTDSQWSEPLRVDLDGTFWTVRAALPWLEKSAHAAVVTVSSILGAHAGSGAVAYQVAKAGIEQMTRALALEFSPRRRVNSIAPGFIRTDMNRAGHEDPAFAEQVRSATPLGRWGEPEDVAPVVRYLLSREADWLTGTVLRVDGGVTLR